MSIQIQINHSLSLFHLDKTAHTVCLIGGVCALTEATGDAF